MGKPGAWHLLEIVEKAQSPVRRSAEGSTRAVTVAQTGVANTAVTRSGRVVKAAITCSGREV